jgi:type I restriction enzyme S subunit
MEETKRSISNAGAQKLRNSVIPENSVCVSCIATIGKVGLTTKPSITNQQINSIICNPDVDSIFLYYAMCHFSHALKFFIGGGAVVANISKSLFGKMEIYLPPFAEQKSIGEKLLLLDMMIDTNKMISDVSLELIQTLFRSWFIDFDPVKAKAEGKLPYGMDEETAALFPDSFEDSELGPIPKDWKWGYLEDCISVIGGGTPSTKNEEFWDGEYNWTSPKDLSNSDSIIMLDTERTITEAGLAKVSSGLLPEDTVLMSSRAPIGYLSLTKIPVAINQGYIAIPPKNNMSPNFMLSWIHYNMPLIEAYSSGSTFPEISKKEFRKLPILIPPAELIEKFNEKTTILYDSMETSLKQRNSLVSTRDALLPRLMSGKLSVS